MRRFFPAFVVALLAAAPAAAGDDGLTGYWKFSIFQAGNQTPFWLIHLESKDGKLTAGPNRCVMGRPQKSKASSRRATRSASKSGRPLSMRMAKGSALCDYEGKLPKAGAKKILGSMSLGKSVYPAIMEKPTSAKTPFAVEMDLLKCSPTDPRAMSGIFEVIEGAEKNKLDAKDLQEVVDGSLKASEAFGPRYQASHTLRLIGSLSEEKAYSKVALDTARKIIKEVDPKSSSALLTVASVVEILRRAKHKDEANALSVDAANRILKHLDEKGSPLTEIRTLTGLAELLRLADKKGQAMGLDVRIEKLEDEAYAEHGKVVLEFKPEKFKG